MSIFYDMLLVALLVVYVVDLSGFTESWRGALQRWLKVEALKPLKPFDCGQCMTWWSCLVYILCRGSFALDTVAFAAFLAFMSVPIGQALMLVREWLCNIINRLSPW